MIQTTHVLARVPDLQTANKLLGLLDCWFGPHWHTQEDTDDPGTYLLVVKPHSREQIDSLRYERARYYCLGFLAARLTVPMAERLEEDTTMAETPIAPPGQGPIVTFGYCRRCRAELNRLTWGGQLPIIDNFNGNWVCRSCWESPNRMEIVKP